MTVSRTMAMFATVLFLGPFASCGPKPDAEEPGKKPKKEPTAAELEAQKQAAAEAPFQAAIQKFNTAVWELNPDMLKEALTAETLTLFLERTQKENQLRGINEAMDVQGFLQQQKDYKIAYMIKSIDIEAKHAVVKGQVEGVDQWESEINFVEVEPGVYQIDHAEVLKGAIAELDETIKANAAKLESVKTKITTLVGDHWTAIKDKNAEMFEGTISNSTSEAAIVFLSKLPKKEGGVKNPKMQNFVDYKKGKMSNLEIKEIDPAGMTVTVIMTPAAGKKPKKGEEPAGPMEKTMKVVEENGVFVLDCSEFLNEKIAALEAAAAEKPAK